MVCSLQQLTIKLECNFLVFILQVIIYACRFIHLQIRNCSRVFVEYPFSQQIKCVLCQGLHEIFYLVDFLLALSVGLLFHHCGAGVQSLEQLHVEKFLTAQLYDPQSLFLIHAGNPEPTLPITADNRSKPPSNLHSMNQLISLILSIPIPIAIILFLKREHINALPPRFPLVYPIPQIGPSLPDLQDGVQTVYGLLCDGDDLCCGGLEVQDYTEGLCGTVMPSLDHQPRLFSRMLSPFLENRCHNLINIIRIFLLLNPTIQSQTIPQNLHIPAGRSRLVLQHRGQPELESTVYELDQMAWHYCGCLVEQEIG